MNRSTDFRNRDNSRDRNNHNTNNNNNRDPRNRNDNNQKAYKDSLDNVRNTRSEYPPVAIIASALTPAYPEFLTVTVSINEQMTLPMPKATGTSISQALAQGGKEDSIPAIH